jgi:bifunctional non-homologous end joining protein LigD
VQSGKQVVHLTHPERLLFADPVITKADLAAFYAAIARFILPGLIKRPLMLLRCPDGAGGECFFQKHVSGTFPAAVHQVTDSGARQRWMYIDNVAGLLGLVQMNAVEYHVWGAQVGDLERCDRLIMDLDPGSGVAWRAVVEAALRLRQRLEAHRLRSFVRTSGGKGLHVVIPLRPAASWESVREFARALAEDVARAAPQLYLTNASKSARDGRIFLDYLRNGRGATAVCSYSVRNRPGTPVATPLSWEELPRVRAADQFRFSNIRRRLSSLRADPWEDIGAVRQRLPRLTSKN